MFMCYNCIIECNLIELEFLLQLSILIRLDYQTGKCHRALESTIMSSGLY